MYTVSKTVWLHVFIECKVYGFISLQFLLLTLVKLGCTVILWFLWKYERTN